MRVQAADLEIGKLCCNHNKDTQGFYDNVHSLLLDAKEYRSVGTFVLLERHKKGTWNQYWCKILTADGHVGWVLFDSFQRFEQL